MRNPSQFHSTPCQRHFDPDCACEETDKMNGTTKVLILISVVLCFLANKACSCAASSQKEQNADNTNDACSSDSGCHSYNQPGSYSAEPGRDYNVFIGSFHVHFYEGQASEKTTSGSSSSKEEAQQQVMLR